MLYFDISLTCANDANWTALSEVKCLFVAIVDLCVLESF